MGDLRVIVVPPDFLPFADRADGYAVVLGDCVLPGHYLARCETAEEADENCRYYADHYGIQGYPLDTNWGRRPVLTLILGGER